MSDALPDSPAELAELDPRVGRASSASSRSASPASICAADEARLMRWLEQGRHGAMDYMQRHGRAARAPAGTGSRNAARDLGAHGLPAAASARRRGSARPIRELGYVSRYALGRDYHKVLRTTSRAAGRDESRRTAPRARIASSSTAARCSRRRSRATPGSAGSASTRICINRQRRLVVLSRRDPHRPAAAGRRAGDRSLRHLPRLHRHLPDAGDRRARTSSTRRAASPISRSSCATRSPRNSARRIGNRIYGCDDCQLVCPWNKFARLTQRDATSRRATVSTARDWSTCSPGREAEFLTRTEGSAIRRIGYECWLRNIAVALGNAPTID